MTTRRSFLRGGAALLATGRTLCSTMFANAREPGRLALENYELTFEDKFEKLDISAYGPGSRWIAHTPWRGDFGHAVFANPVEGFPFTTGPQGLQIEARKDETGRWRSGLICSMSMEGPQQQEGFAQAFGYFEMRARLPEGPGVWPAFWLIGADKRNYTAEIDVMEFYGAFPDRYRSTVHIWRHGAKNFGKGHRVTVPEHSLSAKFNDFGVAIDPEWTTFYFNRSEVWRVATPDEFKQPMYMLANLAIGGGWPYDELTSPQKMLLEHIRVYRLR